jgi:diaminopropionate ammonia-lyase
MVPAWLAKNPRARREAKFGAAQQAVVDPRGIAGLCDLLKECPRHQSTLLHALPALAQRSGVGDVRVKDESQRFGFGAFKALGGVLAVYNELSDATGGASFAELMAGAHRATVSRFVFATASSGNHGRSVAAGARLFGAKGVVFLPKFTSGEKEAAIRARGAEVIRVDGDYDSAVAECRRRSDRDGWTIISDTSWEGYERVPRTVMRGYCVLAREALMQLGQNAPTHVFVQAGVGGLAAAVIGYLWATLPERPAFIVVEPESADCWFQSNLLGRPSLAGGNADTVMGGLACREISPVTWPVVGEGADWFMTIEEARVMPARRLLAQPLGHDPPIASGPSGCAGLAGLLRICSDKATAQALELDRQSRVLLINSEGNLGEQPT